MSPTSPSSPHHPAEEPATPRGSQAVEAEKFGGPGRADRCCRPPWLTDAALYESLDLSLKKKRCTSTQETTACSWHVCFGNSEMDLHDFIDLSAHHGRGHKTQRNTHNMRPRFLGTMSSTISLEKHAHKKQGDSTSTLRCGGNQWQTTASRKQN